MAECIDNEWLEKEVSKTELNMSLEDAYRWIKDSYLHHKTERNAVFTPKAELIALMCINIIADGCAKKSAVLQMLHEAYADGVIDTKDGCRALYKRLNELPEAMENFKEDKNG